MQDAQFQLCCSLLPISYGFGYGHFVTAPGNIKIHHHKKKRWCHNKDYILSLVVLHYNYEITNEKIPPLSKFWEGLQGLRQR
jgi:hypothetical protein